MLECKEVKEYLDSIGLPYDEKESGGMKVLHLVKTVQYTTEAQA